MLDWWSRAQAQRCPPLNATFRKRGVQQHRTECFREGICMLLHSCTRQLTWDTALMLTFTWPCLVTGFGERVLELGTPTCRARRPPNTPLFPGLDATIFLVRFLENYEYPKSPELGCSEFPKISL